MYSTPAICKKSSGSKFEKFEVKRGCAGEDDLEIDVKYCGFCHTDTHLANNDWGSTSYPIVPGHEVAGVVAKVGSNIKDVQVGDHVGIGYFMDTCLNCEFCNDNREILCANGIVATAGGALLHGRIKTDNGKTSHGGWSKKMTANRHFVSKIPKSYPLEKAGPIFCAGITMYNPLKRFGADKGGLNVGIAGFGGLGQMGVMIAKAMGNNVTVISTSTKKEASAREMGATNFVVSKDPESLKANDQTLHLILNTISVPHDLANYLGLLKKTGTIVQLGAFPKPLEVSAFTLLGKQISITGSGTGGLKVTQECMDFIAEKKLFLKTKVLESIPEIDQAEIDLNQGNDAGVRYVIDIEKALQ